MKENVQRALNANGMCHVMMQVQQSMLTQCDSLQCLEDDVKDHWQHVDGIKAEDKEVARDNSWGTGNVL